MINKNNELEIINELEKFVSFETGKITNSILNNVDIKSNFFDSRLIYFGNEYEYGKSFKEVYGKLGIYLFFINCEVSMSKDEVFNYNEYATGGKTKDYKEKHLIKDDCFYLGSATSNSLYTRLNQHFGAGESYSSLHLGKKNRSKLKDKVTIYVFPIKNKKINNVDILLKAIEKRLHEIYSPIAGSKRV